MIVRLLTACGCERMYDNGPGPIGNRLIMPLHTGPTTASLADFAVINLDHVWEGRPVKYQTRTFERSRRDDRDGIATYREVLVATEAT